MSKRIIEALQDRQSKSDFGYGLSTALPYVESVIGACGEGSEMVGDAKQLRKEAGEKLTYCNDDMMLEKAATRSRFKELMPQGMEAPEGTLVVMRHTLTSTKEDRDNDVLVTSGAQLDPKAPLLWQHNHMFPIGPVVGEVDRSKDKLVVVSALLDLNKMTEDAAKLIMAKVLRFSHGFRVLEFNERKAQADKVGPSGFEITKFEIMEASLVSVPSNVDAEIEAFASTKFASDMFRSIQESTLKSAQTNHVKGTDVEELENAVLFDKAKEEDDEKPSADKPKPKPASDDAEDEESSDAEPQLSDGEDKETGKSTDASSELVSTEMKCVTVVKRMSKRNIKSLKDVRDDVEDIGEMDIPRGGKAMCTRCASALSKMIDEAEKPSAGDDEPVDEKPKSATIEEIGMAIMTGELSDEDTQSLKRVIEARLKTRELNTKARSYKRLVSVK